MVKLVFEGWAIIEGKIVNEYLAKPDEKLLVSLFSSPSAYCCDVLEFCGGKLTAKGSFSVKDWGNALVIRAKSTPPSPPPLAICQKSGTLAGRDYILTVYKDTSIKFLLESNQQQYFIVPKADISKPEVIVSSTKNDLLFTVKAGCEEGDYLLIASASDMRVIFEETAQSIRISNTGFTAVKIYEDMCMREKISIYTIENGKVILQSNMFTYSNEHMYIDELKPYLLLEALIVDDYEYVRMLLTDELAEKAQSLKDYFGEIVEIENPRFDKADADLAILSNDFSVSCYKFDFSDGNISNITKV